MLVQSCIITWENIIYESRNIKRQDVISNHIRLIRTEAVVYKEMVGECCIKQRPIMGPCHTVRTHAITDPWNIVSSVHCRILNTTASCNACMETQLVLYFGSIGLTAVYMCGNVHL